MRRLTILVVIAALGLSLSACGRKGKPIAPEGGSYPRNYPNIEFPQGPGDAQQQPSDGLERQYR